LNTISRSKKEKAQFRLKCRPSFLRLPLTSFKDFAGFNGYRLLDISQFIAPIINATIDSESILGVSEFDIDFNCDLIEVNLVSPAINC